MGDMAHNLFLPKATAGSPSRERGITKGNKGIKGLEKAPFSDGVTERGLPYTSDAMNALFRLHLGKGYFCLVGGSHE